MQHPGRRHPALGGVQDKDDTAIALAIQLVLRAREHAPDPVEIVARREIVIGDKRRIVLPEGADIRVVTAAAELVGRGLCEVTLCGDPAVVAQLAAKAETTKSVPRRISI